MPTRVGFPAGFLTLHNRQVITMKSPRIYLYKVTFEEIPDFYWGIHKEKYFGDGYLGSPVTHAWKWDFYTPYLQVCEVFENTDEGWDLAQSVEKRVILNDLDNPLCLNEHCGGYFSLDTCRKAGQIGGSITAKKMNLEKDEKGRSIQAMKGATAGASLKNEHGKSIPGVLGSAVIHRDKDSDGKSIVAKKAGNASLEKKVGLHAPGVASKAGKIGGKVTASQVWESTEDGYRGSAGVVARHNKLRGWDTDARVRIS